MRALVASLFVISCSGPQAIDGHRFKNEPPVLAVNDRIDVPKKPKKREVGEFLHNWDSMVHNRIVRSTELPHRRRALGVNSLDEVPDSTWFTNRIDRLEPDALRLGPNRSAGPMSKKPWKIVASKAAGVAAGFTIEDSDGDRYILKFDAPGFPEYESSTHIVVHRLVWALGFNVPEDYVVSATSGDFVLAEDAKMRDRFGNKRPMTDRDVRDVLSRAHAVDGRMRGLASKYVPGVPIGGVATTGTRPDDPNDIIPHQHRRDMRGLYAVFAWLKHTDVKPNNALDAWVEDPERPGVHYVRHYLIDFGKALGVLGRQGRARHDGYSRWLDFGEVTAATLSLGLRRRSWDGFDVPDYGGTGIIGVDRYDPGKFEVRIPWGPFIEADRFDKFWGAKLLMKLTPEHIRAAVAAAQYSSPKARQFVVDILIRRQRKTARYWFRRVNPLDRFELKTTAGATALCFDDLSRLNGLEPRRIAASTVYRLRSYNRDGALLRRSSNTVTVDRGRVCFAGVAVSGTRDRYTIAEIATERPGVKLNPVLVHLAATKAGALRVIGVRRH